MKQPRHYTKEIDGITVIAYNDSNVEWVVYPKGWYSSPIRYPRNKFTMRNAMESAAAIFKVSKEGAN